MINSGGNRKASIGVFIENKRAEINKMKIGAPSGVPETVDKSPTTKKGNRTFIYSLLLLKQVAVHSRPC